VRTNLLSDEPRAERAAGDGDDRERFIEPIVKTLPMEYAVELSRLIELNMEGAVG
jgi:hypothetical protein